MSYSEDNLQSQLIGNFIRKELMIKDGSRTSVNLLSYYRNVNHGITAQIQRNSERELKKYLFKVLKKEATRRKDLGLYVRYNERSNSYVGSVGIYELYEVVERYVCQV